MSEDIVWEDPPESALNVRRRTPYTEFAQALRAQPGKWAIMPGARTTEGSAKNMAQNVLRGKMRDFPKGEFETAVDGAKVYVRHVMSSATDEHADVVLGQRSYNPKTIRAWARENGFEVPDRGRLPDNIIAAFQEAQEEGGEP